MLRETTVWDLPRCREHREGDWKIEGGAFLAQLGGRKVHDHASVRPEELRRTHGADDPFLCLLHGTVRKPDDRERLQAAAQVRFYLDLAWIEPNKRMRRRARKHAHDGTCRSRAAVCRLRHKTCATRTSSKNSPA